MITLVSAAWRGVVPLAVLVLAACGPTDPRTLNDEGYAALGKGDGRVAIARFESALASADAQHREHARASLGLCEALALIDGPEARRVFLEMGAREPAMVDENEYGRQCAALLRGGFPLDAVAVLHAGNERFPGSQALKDTLEVVIAATSRAPTSDAWKELEKLGYVGVGKGRR